MTIDSALFTFALFDTGFLLFLAVYFLITISDLDCDYINSRMCCSKLNPWVLPEIVCHSLLLVLLLLTGHWFFFLVNAPIVAWIIYRYYTVPVGSMGMFDPADILYKTNNLKTFTIRYMARLLFHLIHFFAYLYCLIIALLTES
ncbi:cornichon-like protein [Brevipalpus obovatus]|uniref:cornichon-like protein n=1 Tax=Brevipalpus obovatus TaxID=246614 RepID=UPI003D9F8A72